MYVPQAELCWLVSSSSVKALDFWGSGGGIPALSPSPTHTLTQTHTHKHTHTHPSPYIICDHLQEIRAQHRTRN